MAKKFDWYAGAKSIPRMGPFDSQAEAWTAVELKPLPGTRQVGVHLPGAYVWPEKPKAA